VGRKVKTPKSDTKKRVGRNSYIGKFEHVFNKRWEDYEIKNLADELLLWMEKADNNLWINDYFISKRISRARVSDFQKNKYFSYVYDLCKGLQESRMFQMGGSKQVNPAMFIMGLKNNHAWTDKQQLEHSGGVKVIRDTIPAKMRDKQ
jgi:hypothetical protein